MRKILYCRQVGEIVKNRLVVAIEAARRELDAHEVAQIPRAELSPLFVDLGVISSDVKCDITLTNTGQVNMLPNASFLDIYNSIL